MVSVFGLIEFTLGKQAGHIKKMANIRMSPMLHIH